MSRILILSFSDISKDARVLKQVREFASVHEVTTVGFGPAPDPRVEHVRVDAPVMGARWLPYLHAALLRARFFGLLERADVFAARARRILRGRAFDAVLANDIDCVRPAVELYPGRVHVDLHEYFPGLHDDVEAWVRLRRPYLEWLLRRFATRANSVTTVAAGIVEEYHRYGLDAEVVSNATPAHALEPHPVTAPIRLVHSGVAQPNRRLELTMRAVARSTAHLTLDLFLMPSDVRYLSELRDLAAELGDRIAVRDPLPQSELVSALNGYDLGVFVLPPTTGNNRHALPNKFFDFVQARVGIVIGPSLEMAGIVREHGLGVVAEGFEEDDLVRVLDALDADEVAEWKAGADRAAGTLSAESQVAVWRRAIEAILAP